VDVMVWTREQVLDQLTLDHHKAIKLCKVLANRLRVQVEGFEKNEANDALVATIVMDASREARKTVDVAWLSAQCGFRPNEMGELIDKWVQSGVVLFEDGKTLTVRNPDLLKNMIKWK
jgi:hypothetical protein